MKTFQTYFFLLTIPIYLLQAELPVAKLDREQPVDFATEIYPVFKANCLSCHNSTKAKADLILESPQDMINGGDSGPAIELGKPEHSLLFTTAAHIEEPEMPPPNNKAKAKNLSPRELALLKRWIAEGAKGERVSTPAPKSWSMLSGPQPIYTSALTRDGRFAAVGRGQNIDIYDLRLGKLATSLVDESLEHPTAHQDIVQSLAFSPDGTTLASGGFRVAKIWNRTPAAALNNYTLPHDPSCTKLSPNGEVLAVGLKDGGISLIDLRSKTSSLKTLKDHKGAVTDLAFSNDGKTLYSVAVDKTVTSRLVVSPEKVTHLVFTVPIQSICVLAKNIAIGGADGAIHICKPDLTPVAEGTPFVTTKVDPQITSPIVNLHNSKDDGSEFIIAHADGNVILAKLNPDLRPVQIRRFSHGATITQIAVTESRLATCGPTGSIKLWNLNDAKIVSELNASKTATSQIATLTRQTAVANQLKKHWDTIVPVEEKLCKAETEKAKTAGTDIAKALREEEAKRIALKTDTDIPKAQEEYKKARQSLTTAKRNREASTKLAGDALARQVAAQSASAEAEALVVAMKSEVDTLTKSNTEAVKTFASTGLAISPDETTIYAALKTGGLRLWETSSGEWLEDLADIKTTGAINISTNNLIAVVGDKRGLTTWQPSGDPWQLTKTIGDGQEADPFADRVSAMAFHPHGHSLIVGSGVPSRNGELSLIDTTTWGLTDKNDTAHDDTITSIAFSPDGSQFVTGGTDRMVKTFTTETLTQLQTFEGHTSHVLDVDWNANNLTLASSGADLQAKVWNIADNKQKSKVEGFQKEVASVSFVADTDSLLTASGDKSLKLANQPLPGAGTTFLHTAAISADGSIIIAAGQDSTLRIWNGKTKKLIQEFDSPSAK